MARLGVGDGRHVAGGVWVLSRAVTARFEELWVQKQR